MRIKKTHALVLPDDSALLSWPLLLKQFASFPSTFPKITRKSLKETYGAFYDF